VADASAPGATDPFDQHGYQFRLDWGIEGLGRIGRDATVVVVVDVLRFTTAVTVAVERGAVVFPFPWAHDDAAAYAAARDAELAGRREDGAWSLSPTDLQRLPAGTRLVLPSPNGSAIAFAARDCGAAVLGGCLRNAPAAGAAAALLAGPDGVVAVIAAGERWVADPALPPSTRVAVEDLAGAGAVLATAALAAASSPEAWAAVETFESAAGDLPGWLANCASGRELVALGWADDVSLAAEHGVSEAVPVLEADAFRLGDAPVR
jgi:2-phosphosulfolactate phosphatase